MTKSLQQINISYVPVQDRLLLRANVQGEGEYRVWLTRRYAALLIGLLDEQIDKAGGMHELASRKETLGLLKGGAFEHPYRTSTESAFPLGEAGVLGFRINLGKTDTGGITLQLLPEQGHGINMNLDTAFLYLLHNLLEQGIRQADWQLALPQHDPQALH